MYSGQVIKSLISRFEFQSLPKSEWTHEAHLVVAIWYCWHNNYDEALDKVRLLILKYNEAVGIPNTDTEGYHESLTRFWLMNAYQFLHEHSCESIASAVNDFILSPRGARSYPLNYYTRDLLFSVEARHNWVYPDLKSMDPFA